MFEHNFYTYKGLADELNTSETALRYWQDRFGAWIPSTGTGEEKWYPRESIEVLRFIMEMVKSGMGENEIVRRLREEYRMIAQRKGEAASPADTEQSPPYGTENTRIMLKEILTVLSETQKRIADAQERIADAEKTKAEALMKRAEAHWVIAESVKGIIPSLGLGIIRNVQDKDDTTDVLVHSESQTDAVNSIDTPGEAGKEIDELLKASVETVALETDDISDLMNAPDLSDSIDISNNQLNTQHSADDIDAVLSASSSSFPEMDDLSDLIDVQTDASEPVIDDLNDLLDVVEEPDAGSMDNLFELIDENETSSEPDIDDLSDLLDQPLKASSEETDDLSERIDKKNETAESGLDDLNDLLDDDMKKTLSGSAGPPVSASLPEGDRLQNKPVRKMPPDYKSKIIALIIQLKEKKGMSIEASTSYLNQKGYKTITGGDEWNQGMIQEIYNHINHVRGSGGAAAG